MVKKLTHLEVRSDRSGVSQSSFLEHISLKYFFANKVKGLKSPRGSYIFMTCSSTVLFVNISGNAIGRSTSLRLTSVRIPCLF